jgi:hypothetical protein
LKKVVTNHLHGKKVMKQLVFLIISSTPSLKNVAQFLKPLSFLTSSAYFHHFFPRLFSLLFLPYYLTMGGRFSQFKGTAAPASPDHLHLLIQSGRVTVAVALLEHMGAIIYPCIKVWETFELNQLKSTPSQLLPVFSGFDWLQTCCNSFGPANILLFFQVLAKFFFIVMTTGQELGQEPVFQCRKILKFNNEAKVLLVRHSPSRYKPIINISPKP